MLISIGCTVYLSCENRYVGAFLFSTALCAICTLDMDLFTGKVCFTRKARELPGLLVCLTGNVVGCVAGASLIGMALPDVAQAAAKLCAGKLEREPLQVIILAVFCGILMAVAVGTYRTTEGISKYIGIFTCIPTFILCGFEHSIADVAFLALANTSASDAALFCVLNVAGNTLGGQLIGRSVKI